MIYSNVTGENPRPLTLVRRTCAPNLLHKSYWGPAVWHGLTLLRSIYHSFNKYDQNWYWTFQLSSTQPSRWSQLTFTKKCLLKLCSVMLIPRCFPMFHLYQSALISLWWLEYISTREGCKNRVEYSSIILTSALFPQWASKCDVALGWCAPSCLPVLNTSCPCTIWGSLNSL